MDTPSKPPRQIPGLSRQTGPSRENPLAATGKHGHADASLAELNHPTKKRRTNSQHAPAQPRHLPWSNVPPRRRRLQWSNVPFPGRRLPLLADGAKRLSIGQATYVAITAVQLRLEADTKAMIGAFAGLRLHDPQPTGLHALPNEVLLRIAEFLVPNPVTISRDEVPFLRTRETDEWLSFFEGREDVANLSRVSRRFQGLVGPLLYRNVFLKKTSSLCQFILRLALKPSLGPAVRHINSAINLYPDRFDEFDDTWWSALLRCFPQPVTSESPATSPILLFSLLDDWTEFSAERKKDFPGYLFAALLATTNRVEEVGILLPPLHLAREPDTRLPPMWTWLLKRGVWPFPDPRRQAHHNTGDLETTYPTLPTVSELKTAPFWPPPFLHSVVVQHNRGTSCGDWIVQLDIVPHSESIEHAALLQRCAFGLLNPNFIRNPLNLREMAGSVPRHLQLLNYLNGLKKLPSIRDGGQRLASHIDNLQAITISPDPTGYAFDIAAD
ncbi:hypothetical protein QBC34DRAFT_422942 [Podospora aff. communis PSN243]|uniref:F-box domain-containing protein n=1 Tax=Podospora aff. communis PSN243 TaxID=3040156 RepID=A0AAV9GVT9_9PEZI|nr:hypothetical protein QBC34DRAFT_422942 [Podospora aff. communis PSN243]